MLDDETAWNIDPTTEAYTVRITRDASGGYAVQLLDGPATTTAERIRLSTALHVAASITHPSHDSEGED